MKVNPEPLRPAVFAGAGSRRNPSLENDRVFYVLGLIYLLILGCYVVSVINQPVYHAGLFMELHDDGWRVRKVAAGSNAAATGLRPGMVVTRLNGIDAKALSLTSVRDLAAFLKTASGLFVRGETVSIQTADGSRHTFTLDSLENGARITVLLPTLLLNFLTGAFFILAGMSLVRKGTIRREARWFTLFCFSAGLAIAFSRFHSYWTYELIMFRFVLLDICAVAAGSFLFLFAKSFPAMRRINIPGFLLAFIFPLMLKYLLLSLTGSSPLGPAAYFIHVYLFGALVTCIVIFLRQYREVCSGAQRRIRWILTGAVISLFPYVLVILLIAVKGDMLAFGMRFMMLASNLGLLLFPGSVIVGVLRFNLFDIDRFLREFVTAVLFILVCVLLYLAARPVVRFILTGNHPFLLFLLTCLGSPVLFMTIRRACGNLFRRGIMEKNLAFHKLENTLTGLFQRERVLEESALGIGRVFSPSCLSFSFLSADGDLVAEFQKEWERSRSELADFSRTRDLDRTPSTVHHTSGGISLPLMNTSGLRGFLYCGRKLNDDYYTPDEAEMIRVLCSRLMSALENCGLYSRLKLSEQNEMHARKVAIIGLAKLAEHRDQTTGKHLERISEYSRLLAGALMERDMYSHYINTAYIDDLSFSSTLHDIGKVGVSDEILNKPSALTSAEFLQIQKHAAIGGKVLEESERLSSGRSFLALGKVIAYHHHEWWDGTGYPSRLKGESIPLAARIVTIADVYDALTSDRPYRPSMSHAQACDIIVGESGTHFDPVLVDVFCAVTARFDEIRLSLQ